MKNIRCLSLNKFMEWVFRSSTSTFVVPDRPMHWTLFYSSQWGFSLLCNRRLKINISINQSIHISCYKQTFQLFHLTKLGCLVSFCGLYICLILSIVEWLELMIAQGLWYMLVALPKFTCSTKKKSKKKIVFLLNLKTNAFLKLRRHEKATTKNNNNKKNTLTEKFGLRDLKWFYPQRLYQRVYVSYLNNPITRLDCYCAGHTMQEELFDKSVTN